MQTKTLPVFICDECGWQPQPGQRVRCHTIESGPWFCPTCEAELPTVILTEGAAEMCKDCGAQYDFIDGNKKFRSVGEEQRHLGHLTEDATHGPDESEEKPTE